jgi:hypothetical protein
MGQATYKKKEGTSLADTHLMVRTMMKPNVLDALIVPIGKGELVCRRL